MTNLWTGQRWAYLAVVNDLFAHQAIGWATSHSPDSQLTGKVQSMAFVARGKPQGMMFHSDQESYDVGTGKNAILLRRVRTEKLHR